MDILEWRHVLEASQLKTDSGTSRTTQFSEFTGCLVAVARLLIRLDKGDIFKRLDYKWRQYVGAIYHNR